MTNGYSYDAINNLLTISAAFAKKASKIDTPEYSIMLKLQKDHPDLTIKKEEKKEVKKGLNYAKMEEFIAMHRNAAELTKIYNSVRKLSRIQSMPYMYVKSWFNKRFPYYSEEPTFDADGFVVDPATLTAANDKNNDKNQEMITADQTVRFCLS